LSLIEAHALLEAHSMKGIEK